MAQPYNQVKESETDIAFALLQGNGRPMHYRELIEEVLQRLSVEAEPGRISSVLTQINLDTRFAYVGQGEWGLKAWVPTKGNKRMPSITLMNKSVTYDDETDRVAGDENDDAYDMDADDVDEDALDSEDELDEDIEEETEPENWE